jgi:hypothetical protein
VVLDYSWHDNNDLASPSTNVSTNILHQEIAFSFADILQDQARRSNFRDELERV